MSSRVRSITSPRARVKARLVTPPRNRVAKRLEPSAPEVAEGVMEIDQEGGGRKPSIPTEKELQEVNLAFNIAVLERKLVANKITLNKFKKGAEIRPRVQDLFEFGKYALIFNMKRFPEYDNPAALIADYRNTTQVE